MYSAKRPRKTKFWPFHVKRNGVTIVSPKRKNPNIMNLENYTKMRALEWADKDSNSVLLDHLLAGKEGDGIRENMLTKRLQFDTTPELYAEVENVCTMLECSKRQFLEMAVCDAINKTNALFGATYEQAVGHPFGELVSDKE